MYKLTEKLSVNYELLTEVVPQDVIRNINSDRSYNIMRAFGVSPLIFLKILLNETDLKLNELNNGRYESSIRFIQHKYGLSVDGKVGPCTALLLSSLSQSVREDGNHAELSQSVFHDNPNLVWVLSACSKDDKRSIRWIMERDDDLSKKLNYSIVKLGMDITTVASLINTSHVNPEAYDALRSLHKIVSKNEDIRITTKTN